MLSKPTRVQLALFLLTTVACYEREWRPLLPEGKASLVVVFDSDLGQQEINDFLNQELQIEAADGGEWLKPGVDTIAQTSVDGHQAYAVVLDPSATPEEREAIREGVKNSPYVYRVFENVKPEDIRLDETPDREGGEAAQDQPKAPPQ